MTRKAPPKYTLVQHSGGVAGKPAFEHAVEAVSVKPADLAKIATAGGLIFNSYTEAEQAEEQINWPEGVEGMTPQARGTFHATVKVNGLPLYIPEAAK